MSSSTSTLPKPWLSVSKLPEVEARTGLSGSSIYRLVKAGQFPRPIKLGETASAWVDEEIEDWLIARVEERNKLEREEAVKRAREATDEATGSPV
jgi:prophage regulatory protein